LFFVFIWYFTLLVCLAIESNTTLYDTVGLLDVP